MRIINGFGLFILVVMLSGCFAREQWTRADLFAATEAAKSVKAVAADIESVAFLGGIQRGLNLNLDQPVLTDQGLTSRIYLEQTVQLPTAIILQRRVLVHFDAAGSPLYIENIAPPMEP